MKYNITHSSKEIRAVDFTAEMNRIDFSTKTITIYFERGVEHALRKQKGSFP